ncbi:HtaA domain-containing protein [Microbacterium sp. RD1]|uniref:HtaA domain-containing protein n=1 Tax=Microbacterium sp. RD1 TaxID=3457313 RepID=UPI003FA539BD
MSALVWGVKQSLLAYVRSMEDGVVATDGGATASPAGFVFPGDGLEFAGSVTLTGHGGMMRVTLADPRLVEADGRWVLEIADPDDPGVRLPFALVATFDGVDGTGVTLTADGADLFFGPYGAGTALDDLSVRG